MIASSCATIEAEVQAELFGELQAGAEVPPDRCEQDDFVEREIVRLRTVQGTRRHILGAMPTLRGHVDQRLTFRACPRGVGMAPNVCDLSAAATGLAA